MCTQTVVVFEKKLSSKSDYLKTLLLLDFFGSDGKFDQMTFRVPSIFD